MLCSKARRRMITLLVLTSSTILLAQLVAFAQDDLPAADVQNDVITVIPYVDLIGTSSNEQVESRANESIPMTAPGSPSENQTTMASLNLTENAPEYMSPEARFQYDQSLVLLRIPTDEGNGQIALVDLSADTAVPTEAIQTSSTLGAQAGENVRSTQTCLCLPPNVDCLKVCDINASSPLKKDIDSLWPLGGRDNLQEGWRRIPINQSTGGPDMREWDPLNPSITEDGKVIKYFNDSKTLRIICGGRTYDVIWDDLYPEVPENVSSPNENTRDRDGDIRTERSVVIRNKDHYIVQKGCYTQINCAVEYDVTDQRWIYQGSSRRWTTTNQPRTTQNVKKTRITEFSCPR